MLGFLLLLHFLIYVVCDEFLPCFSIYALLGALVLDTITELVVIIQDGTLLSYYFST